MPEPREVIRAAGAICWRPAAGGGLELLMVHSARWGDWSWPKGKLDPDETLPECAVREVMEETGVRPELGVQLPSVQYVMPDGRAKTVNYWAARPRQIGPRTALDEEISDVAWLPIEAALARLTRPSDFPPVDRLLELAELGWLDTHPLLILRHAKARSRSSWPGQEADRPLTTTGQRQSVAVAQLLSCWAPQQVLSSPWARCMQTLRPYLDSIDPSGQAEPEVLPLLSEEGVKHDPNRVGETIADLTDHNRSALLCTHRPVLAGVIAAIREAAAPNVIRQLPTEDPWLAPAEILVAHVSQPDPRQPDRRRIHALERHYGESPRKRRRRALARR